MVGSRLRRVPPWGWLTAIVVVSFLVRAWLARGMVAPFIMVDELIYSELGRSIGADFALRVRDVEAGGFSVVYPLLISPAYALFENLPNAYAAVKTLNSLYMSLAAIPAYFLARRVLGPPLSLVGALLTVAVPSLVYTGTVMTENVFYPLFLTVALVLVLVLERPTLTRQAVLLTLVAIAFGTRVQAVAMVPAILVAPLLLALLQKRPLRATLRPFWALYAAIAGAALLVLGLQAARGRSLTDLLGAYSVVGDGDYQAGQVARFFLYHLAELDLYLGILPFAAFIIVVALARRLDPPIAPFVAAGVALSVSFLLVVAAFASVFANRIQERNTFIVAPFFLIGLLVWVDRGAPRPLVLSVAAAVGAALLPLAIPFERFVETGAISDTLALLPIWDAYGSLLFDSIDATVLVGGALAAALFLLVPRRYALALPLVTLVFFLAMSRNIWFGERGFKRASAGALFQGIRTGDRELDRRRRAGRRQSGDRLDRADGSLRRQPERVLQPPRRAGLLRRRRHPGRSSRDRGADRPEGRRRPARRQHDPGRALRAPGQHDRTRPRRRGRAGSGARAHPVALDAPLVSSQTDITGLYPNDSWSGKQVTFTRQNCRGGTLTVALESDPALFTEPQTVTVSVGGEVVERARIPPLGSTVIHVPLRPESGACTVVFDVAATRVPAEVTDGANADTRELGVHFRNFQVTP